MTTPVTTRRPVAAPRKERGYWANLATTVWRHRFLYLMLVPGFIFYAAFRYYPLMGNIIAFKDYKLAGGVWGSPWIGFTHFRDIFSDPLFVRALRNTVSIAFLKLVIYFPSPILVALFLNEIRVLTYKRFIQTIIYVPHFLSWVIYAAILYIVLSPVSGLVNVAIEALGFKKIFFFQRQELFQPIVVVSSILKQSGWAAIIYLATISSINPELYEAAAIDGANRWQVMRNVTIPGLMFTIVTLFIIQIGYFLNVGFEQVFVMQNSMVLRTGDIIETWIYREGIRLAKFDFTTAAGLFNSAVGMAMVLAADRVAKRLGQEGIL